MAKVMLRVGASKDASVNTTFASIETRAKQCRKIIDAELRAAGAGAIVHLESEAKKTAAAVSSPFRVSAKEIGDGMRQAADTSVREFERIEREAKKRRPRSPRLTGDGAGEGFFADAKRAWNTSSLLSGVAGGAAGLMRAGVGVAGSLARGAGVDLDPSSLIKKSVDQESMSVALSNSGYMQGDARNGKRVDPSELRAQAMAVGNAAAFDTGSVLAGLQQFTAKTGDLATGRDVLKELATLSKATGTNLEDMVDAAGDVSNNLGDIPNKGEAIASVMKTIAGQGKIGAVEMKDFASQMAKVAANAPQFEGAAGRNIAILGALAQESRARGGSASATQAATSVASFTNTFSKGARLDAFKNFKVSTQGAGGMTRDPLEIIKDALRAASSKERGGMAAMNENMGKMFMDVRARSAVKGFENIYKQAGGGDAGMAAVEDEMTKLTTAAMGAAEEMDSFKAAMSTTESKAQLLNNGLQASADQLREGLSKPLADLTPTIISAAKAFASFIDKFTGADEDRYAKDYKATRASAVNTLRKAETEDFGKLGDDGKTARPTQETQDALAAEKKRMDAQLAKAKADRAVDEKRLKSWNPFDMVAKDQIRTNLEEHKAREGEAFAGSLKLEAEMKYHSKLLEEQNAILRMRPATVPDINTGAPPKNNWVTLK